MEAQKISNADRIDYTPSGADVQPGQIVIQANVTGVASKLIPDGQLGSLDIRGDFDVAKATGGGTGFSAGAAVHFDTVNRVAVNASGSDTVRIGSATQAAGTVDTHVRTLIVND